MWTAGRRDSTVFGVVDDTTTTKFVNRACAVHGISLPVVVDKVVVVILKFPIVFRGSSGRYLLSFVPYFSACLNFALPLLSAPGSPRMSLQQEEKPKKKKRSKDKDRNKFTVLIRRCNATLTETIKQARLGEFVKELFFDISGENEIEIMNKLFISLPCLRVRDIIFRLRVVPHFSSGIVE